MGIDVSRVWRDRGAYQEAYLPRHCRPFSKDFPFLFTAFGELNLVPLLTIKMLATTSFATRKEGEFSGKQEFVVTSRSPSIVATIFIPGCLDQLLC